jgi:hypothetical protein
MNTLSLNNSQLTELAVWIVTLLLVASGFRFAKQVIALGLDKLYEFFILKNQSL